MVIGQSLIQEFICLFLKKVNLQAKTSKIKIYFLILEVYISFI